MCREQHQAARLRRVHARQELELIAVQIERRILRLPAIDIRVTATTDVAGLGKIAPNRRPSRVSTSSAQQHRDLVGGRAGCMDRQRGMALLSGSAGATR